MVSFATLARKRTGAPEERGGIQTCNLEISIVIITHAVKRRRKGASRMKGKKILVFLGSPRRNGNSALLAKEMIEGAKAGGARVETFYLHGMKIKPCTACDACRRKNQKDCILKDDMAPLYSKLRKADGIVIATPVYWFTVSAQT